MSIFYDFANTCNNIIAHNSELGILLCGFIAFIESLAIIGSIVPGSIMMTLVGISLGSGTLPWRITVFSVFIGALIGDYLSYWLGKKYKENILKHRWVTPYHDWIVHGEAFIKTYGTSSIVIGRFFGPMRSLIPMIAGILNMPYLRFTLAIIPTATLWTIVYLTPGILIGAISADIAQLGIIPVIKYTLYIVAVIALWYALPTLVHKFDLRLPLTNPDTHIEQTHKIKAFLLFILSTTLCVLEIPAQTFFTETNTIVNNLIAALGGPLLYNFATQISALTHPVSFILASVGSSFLLWKKNRRTGLYFALISFSFFSIIALLKTTLPMARPITQEITYGFPSGNTMLIPTLWLIFSSILESKSHKAGMTMRRIGLLLLTLVAASRVIIQAHYFSQVLISALLVMTLHHLFSSYRQTWQDKLSCHAQQLLNTIIIAMLTINLAHNIMVPTQGPPSAPVINYPSERDIPSSRAGLTGYSSEPLNLYSRMDQNELITQFIQQNWVIHTTQPGIISRLQLLNTYPYLYNPLPIIPPLFKGNQPRLIMSKRIDDLIYIIRLWDNEGDSIKMIGSITKDKHPNTIWSKDALICNPDRYNINRYAKDIMLDGKTYTRQPITVDRPPQGYQWDGKILILN